MFELWSFTLRQFLLGFLVSLALAQLMITWVVFIRFIFSVLISLSVSSADYSGFAFCLIYIIFWFFHLLLFRTRLILFWSFLNPHMSPFFSSFSFQFNSMSVLFYFCFCSYHCHPVISYWHNPTIFYDKLFIVLISFCLFLFLKSQWRFVFSFGSGWTDNLIFSLICLSI